MVDGPALSDEYQNHGEAQGDKRPSGGATNLRRGRTISSRSGHTWDHSILLESFSGFRCNVFD